VPTFELTSPDGKKYRVKAPEGATREQAFQQLQQHLSTPDPNRGMLEKVGEFGRGQAKAIAGTVAGIGSMLPGADLPGLPPEAQQARARAKQELGQFTGSPDRSGYETAGRYVGDVMSTAGVPGLGVGRAAGAIGSGLTRISPTLLDIAALFHLGGLSPWVLARHLPHLGGRLGLERLARAAAPYVGAGARGAGTVGEKVGVAEAARRLGGPDASSDQGSPEAPRGAPVAPGDQAFRPGRGDRWQGGRGQSDNSAAD
jgi:hypothetical protein